MVPRLYRPLCSLFALVVTVTPVAPLAAQSRPSCDKPDCQLTLDEAWARVAQANQRKQAFVGALRQLTVALAGTFGDEGTRVQSSIESMELALDEWDRSILAFEVQLRQADRPAGFHMALGAVYLDRNRLDDALREFVEASRLDTMRADAHTFQALSSALLNKPVPGRPGSGQGFFPRSGQTRAGLQPGQTTRAGRPARTSWRDPSDVHRVSATAVDRSIRQRGWRHSVRAGGIA